MADPKKTPPDPLPPVPPGHGRDVWQTIGRLDLFNRAIALIAKGLPAFTHSITVDVVGGPKSDIRRIWYLCVSAALGRYRNRVSTSLSPMSVSVTWDVSGKAVSIELAYQMNKLMNFNTDMSDPTGNPLGFFMRGPEQLTVGAGWDDILHVAPAIGARLKFGGMKRSFHNAPGWMAMLSESFRMCLSSAAAIPAPVRVYGIVDDFRSPVAAAARSVFPSSAPINTMRELPLGAVSTPRPDPLGMETADFRVTSYPYRVTRGTLGAELNEPTEAPIGSSLLPALPDDGRIITTVEKNDVKVQPPKPPFDGHTRCGLLALVAQSLQNPCFLPTSPPCTDNPVGGAGRFVGRPGLTGFWKNTGLAKLFKAAGTVETAWPLGANVGPDGYPINSRVFNFTSP